MRCTSAAVHVAYLAVYTAGFRLQHISQKYKQSSVLRLSVELPVQKHTEAYRHKLVSFSFPQSLHYIKKRPRGVQRGRGLVPFCGFLTFQCNLPSAGRSLWHIRPEIPQPIRHIQPEFRTHGYTAGFRNLCGYIRRGLRNLYYANISYRNIQSSV